MMLNCETERLLGGKLTHGPSTTPFHAPPSDNEMQEFDIFNHANVKMTLPQPEVSAHQYLPREHHRPLERLMHLQIYLAGEEI